MKKISLVFSCLSILAGAIVIILTSILNQVMPKLGYIAFQAHGGSYSPGTYEMDFTVPNVIAVALIILGIIITVRIFTQPSEK